MYAAEIFCHNALSVDVEEWFQVRNLEGAISRDSWEEREQRVEEYVVRLLDLFDRKGVTATFFVLGWVAERSPDLVREIYRRGHEIALHGYGHQSVTSMSPEVFEKDIQRGLSELRSLIPGSVEGYRAPSFSLQGTRKCHFDILKRAGILYDSSYFPGRKISRNDLRPPVIHRMANGLIEVPLTSVSLCGVSVPCGGGGSFRLFPYPVTRFLLKRREKSGEPVVFYVHPWEIDPGQPKVKLSFINNFKHRVNLSRTFLRLERLLEDFQFRSIREVLSEYGF